MIGLVGLACSGGPTGAPREVVLASTTSTEDSGLFDVLLPAFQRAHPEYRIKLIAVGTGEALAYGRRRDADVLLVHAPAEEQAFMRAGHGRTHRPVMTNDFVIVGPAEDPARVGDASDALEALGRIAAARAIFVSRGDSSGTHRKELELWSAAGGRPPDPRRAWYLEIGQGMGDALRVANERHGYTLSDRATFLFLSALLELRVLFEGDAVLFNPYAVITVAGARNEPGAEAFASWLVAPAARALIAAYGVEPFGQPLFRPAS